MNSYRFEECEERSKSDTVKWRWKIMENRIILPEELCVKKYIEFVSCYAESNHENSF